MSFIFLVIILIIILIIINFIAILQLLDYDSERIMQAKYKLIHHETFFSVYKKNMSRQEINQRMQYIRSIKRWLDLNPIYRVLINPNVPMDPF